MKLERLPEYVTVTLVTLIGILVAVYCGKAAGSGQMGLVGVVCGGAIGITIALAMGKRIWLLIVWLCLLDGRLMPIPAPLNVDQLMVMGSLVLFIGFRALKLIKEKPQYGMLDLWMLINLLWIASEFFRHPTGVLWLNSDRIAGRPYAEILIALCAYWVLIRVTMEPEDARRIPVVALGFSALQTTWTAISYFIPSSAPVLAKFYSAVASGGDSADVMDSSEGGEAGEQSRLVFFSIFGGHLTRVLMSYFPPLTLINPLYIFRFFCFIVGVIGILLGGFRSGLAGFIGTFLICSYLKQGWRAVLIHIAVVLPILSVVVMLQGRAYELPYTAQRALSFLPGKWDANALEAAKGSTEWRVEMWRTVLSDRKYIQNKLLGDGFGYSQNELITLLIQQANGTLGDMREIFMVQGSVHSGPVSAIKFGGYIGLGLFYCLQFALAHAAWKLIRRSSGTPYSPIAYFFGLPMIWLPINYTFIFGAYEKDLPLAIFSVGMIRAIDSGLKKYKARLAEESEDAESFAPKHNERKALLGTAMRLGNAS